MKVKRYGDDGYVESELYNEVESIDVLELLDILYEKKLLSVDDVNRILPEGLEVAE